MLRVMRRKICRLVWVTPFLVLIALYVYTGAKIPALASLQLQSTASSPTVPSSATPESIAGVVPTTTKPIPRCQPQRSFVFIKTHKSGSTTMIAPFQKYAYLHNLTMMVPSLDNNIHLSWPHKFIPNLSHMVAPDGQKFEALVNHIIYNKESVQPLMAESAKYLTIIREPVPHLISSFQYFSVNKDNQFLRLGPREFELFLSDPVRYDPNPAWMKLLKNTQINSLTRNLQSADLGLHYTNFDNSTAVNLFVKEIKDDFSILIVLERLSESLVLMKRKFCWSMQDIIHVNKNVQKTQWNWNFRNISKNLLGLAYKWNNADTLLYKMAGEKLNELKAGELDLDKEIKVYDTINTRISQYCGGNINSWKAKILPKPLVIEKTAYNERFEVDGRFCTLLLIKEEDLTLLLKCRQYPQYQQCADNANEISVFRSLIHGKGLHSTSP